MTVTPGGNENEVPLKIVGSTVFGRYPKISVEETYNFIISDKFLVPYAGYAAILMLVLGGKGRGAFTSTSGDITIAVVSNNVFVINADLTYQIVGQLATSTGDVFIAENNNFEIAITDYSNIYVYSYGGSPITFKTSTTETPGANQFAIPTALTNPGYITFQNGRLLVAGTGTSNWYLSDFNMATVWTGVAGFASAHTGTIQTKSDTVQAPVRFPGRGNLLLVFGFTVAEPWTDQGLALFPYVKSTTFNLDYGCLNAASIDSLENYVGWLAQNEKSGPALMFTDGSSITRISTDGIDFKLSNLTNPTDCFGFFFRQDGHLIYQFTFPTDNLSYAYDFNTKKFFTVTDENLNYHPAKKVVFFNGVYYFVSNRDGNFYEFDTSITNYTYSLPNSSNPIVKEIPRIRICPPLRLDNQKSFIVKNLSFTIEQGQPNNIIYGFIPQPIPYTCITTESGALIMTESGYVIQTTAFMGSIKYPLSDAGVDLSISRDGGQTFGNSVRKNMNPTGKAKSLFIYRQLGRLNDSSTQLRFWGMKRFVVTDGIVEVRK